MEKCDVQKLVDVKSDRLSFEINKAKSSVWRSFQLITVDSASVPFVKCIKCNAVLRWKSRDGTSGLSAHIDACSSKLPQPKLTSLAGFTPKPTAVKIPSNVKSDVTDVVVQMCAKDVRWVNLLRTVLR